MQPGDAFTFYFHQRSASGFCEYYQRIQFRLNSGSDGEQDANGRGRADENDNDPARLQVRLSDRLSQTKLAHSLS